MLSSIQPQACLNAACTNRGNSGKWELDTTDSIFVDWQRYVLSHVAVASTDTLE